MSKGKFPTFKVWDKTTISIANNLIKSKTTNLSFFSSLIYITNISIALKYLSITWYFKTIVCLTKPKERLQSCNTNMNKLEMVSLRIPSDLLKDLDAHREHECADRTTIILRALRYWLKIDGKVTTDYEILTRLSEIEQSSKEMKNSFLEYQGDIKDLKGIIAQQQATIDTLLRMLPKNNQ